MGYIFDGRKRTIYALIGSNGAGKTTLLKTISGWLHPISGSIEFLDKQDRWTLTYVHCGNGDILYPGRGPAFP